MPNSLLTISQITRKTALVLHQKLNFIGAMNRGYDDSFAQSGAKIGDTLRIRLPNQYVARTTMQMQAQNTEEQKVDLAVTNVAGTDMHFTSEDLALSLDDFSERIIDPAAAVVAASIESTVYQGLYKQVYNLVDGDAAAFGIDHLGLARQVLTENLAPATKRTAILAPKHVTKLNKDVKAFTNPGEDISESFREGKIGRAQGFEIYENTHFADHTTGTAVKTTGYTSNGAHTTNGTSTITIQTGSTTFLKGDVVTFADCYAVHPETKVQMDNLQQFVVTETTGTSATSLKISPAIYTSGARQNVVSTGIGATKAIVKVGAAANEKINGSLAFFRDAFVFATADLPMPKGVDMASSVTVDGLRISLVRDFNISDRTFPSRLDVLYGYAALRPQLACRIHADG